MAIVKVRISRSFRNPFNRAGGVVFTNAEAQADVEPGGNADAAFRELDVAVNRALGLDVGPEEIEAAQRTLARARELGKVA